MFCIKLNQKAASFLQPIISGVIIKPETDETNLIAGRYLFPHYSSK